MMKKESSIKSVYILFGIVIFLHICLVFLISFGYLSFVIEDLFFNLLISEMVLWIPFLVYCLIFGKNLLSVLGFKKVSVKTVLLSFVYSILAIPVASLFNLLSQLFTKNEVAEVLLGESFASPVVLVFLLGIYGPFAEELVYRGVIFGTLKKKGNLFLTLIISSVFFGLMHMNLNQLFYAIPLGLLMGLLYVATDSIWPGLIMHCTINTVESGFLQGLLSGNEDNAELAEQVSELSRSANYKTVLIMAVGLFFVLAVVCVAFLIAILRKIAASENRLDVFKDMWYNRKKEVKAYFNPTILIGIVLCIGFMLFL